VKCLYGMLWNARAVDASEPLPQLQQMQIDCFAQLVGRIRVQTHLAHEIHHALSPREVLRTQVSHLTPDLPLVWFRRTEPRLIKDVEGNVRRFVHLDSLNPVLGNWRIMACESVS
jgi:hypothetical protein